MSKRKFNIGDVCRIREWDDMAEEFGVDEEDDDVIECEYKFIADMRYLCGERFTIKRRDYTRFYSEEGLEGDYSISADMLELIEAESTAPPITTKDFNAILNL